jgi:hypothetical protein
VFVSTVLAVSVSVPALKMPAPLPELLWPIVLAITVSVPPLYLSSPRPRRNTDATSHLPLSLHTASIPNRAASCQGDRTHMPWDNSSAPLCRLPAYR